MEKLMTHNSGY